MWCGLLAGDVGVEAGVAGCADHVARAAGDDTHPRDPVGAAGDQSRSRREGPQRPVHLADERVPGAESGRREAPDPDRAPLVVPEPPFHLDPQAIGEHHVVPHLRVHLA